jgi:hydrogenase-4 component E
MSTPVFNALLDAVVGVALVSATLVLWRRRLAGIVRGLAVLGGAVAAVPVLIGLHERDLELVGVGVLIGILKAGVIPAILLRMLRGHGEDRETDPLVNVPASLLAGAVLTAFAYLVCAPIMALDGSVPVRAVPLGVSVVLIGFFVLTTRRRAIAQVVGFLLVENGITLVAFLATGGVPLVVELGASLDLFLAVLVLQVLTGRMRTKFGDTDLNRLRELHD